MKLLSSILLTTAIASGAAVAEEAKVNQSDTKPESSAQTAIDSIALADQLARYGDQSGNAVALLLAADIKKSTPTKDAEHSKIAGGGEADAKDSGVDYSVDALLTRGRALAGDNEQLLNMADDIADRKSRGYIDGPQQHQDRVLARSTDIYELVYEGGRPAEILVSGDGDTDLDLFVYDENGNLICKDDDTTDTMYCGWHPRWTGKFRIEIVNLGTVYNVYELYTN